MNIGTGIVGTLLVLGVWVASSTHPKTAEARSVAFASVAVAAVSTVAVRSTVVVPSTNTVAECAAVASAPLASFETSAVARPPSQVSLPTLAPPRTLRRLETGELTPAMMRAAAQVVREHYAKPVGTNIAIQIDGKPFVARIERHYHPEGGPSKPWGFHTGVSLLAER